MKYHTNHAGRQNRSYLSEEKHTWSRGSDNCCKGEATRRRGGRHRHKDCGGKQCFPHTYILPVTTCTFILASTNLYVFVYCRRSFHGNDASMVLVEASIEVVEASMDSMETTSFLYSTCSTKFRPSTSMCILHNFSMYGPLRPNISNACCIGVHISSQIDFSVQE